MSIVPLKRITLYGCLSEKLAALEELQSLGCMHIVSLYLPKSPLDKRNVNTFTHSREALRHLSDCPHRLKQIENTPVFEPAALERQALHNKHQTDELQNEKDVVLDQIQQLSPWGNFTLPDPAELGGQNFWFYIVPRKEMKNFHLEKWCAALVQKDAHLSYVAVVAENEPEGIPGTQVKLPERNLEALKARLDEIEFKLEDLQLERIHLTRWLTLFEKELYELENQAILVNASQQTYDTHPLFALQGWIPASEVDKMKAFAAKKELAFKIEEADAKHQPPTLLKNKAAFQGGEDLLSFYMTPNYSLWDPSATVFFSFAVFFAMIFSDAGYAIILGAILAFLWRPLGKTVTGYRFRNVLLALTVFSFIWGMLVGSYFGIAPSSGSYFSYLKIIDMSNYTEMMTLAVLVGVTHIVIANIAQARAKRKSLTALASIGWAMALMGATTAFFGMKYPLSIGLAKTIGYGLMIAGLFAILLFTTLEKPLWKRLLAGMIGLTRVTGMFGDVLSYLRLFALGLASASLAAVFNDLAKQVYHAMPGFNILLAVLIVLIGHGINFLLSLMGGFIHGLRLNYIEFFNWSLPEEGAPFKAFSKKEISKWNQ